MVECFGEIRNGIMGLNELGCAVATFWQEIPMHFENVTLDEWVVMPNHVHGVIIINKTPRKTQTVVTQNVVTQTVETRHGASLRLERINAFGPLQSNSLQCMINHFKGAVTRWCRKNKYLNFSWQSRFYDRVIRNEDELNRICEYIQNNPLKWEWGRNNS